MSKIVNDIIAEKLELSGLWRRAASRWLNIMQRYSLNDEQREWVRQRRLYCYSRIKPASRLQALKDLLAEGLSSGKPVEWEKDAFLKKVKADSGAAGENR